MTAELLWCSQGLSFFINCGRDDWAVDHIAGRKNIGENNGKRRYPVLPEEYPPERLEELYRNLPMTGTAVKLLSRYFIAMANLYGIIPLHKAYEIIASHNPELVTRKEFLAYAEIARHECGEYYILGAENLLENGRESRPMEREIVDIMLIGSTVESYRKTWRNQQGKPYYVPKKAQLLAYENPFYCEDTPEKQRLIRFLRSQFVLSTAEAEEILIDFLFAIRSVSFRMQDAFLLLDHTGARFHSESSIEKFAGLFSEFHNTTRMPCNRGHTPAELMSMRLGTGRL